MKFIAFIQDYAEIKKILKHLDLWPVEYPRIKEGDHASPVNLPFNLDLLSKRLKSKHIN